MATTDLSLVNDHADGSTIADEWLNDVADILEGNNSYLELSVAGSANVTLTEAQARYDRLKLTGVLTGNIQVRVPATPRKGYWVWNATSGAFTVTVKRADGGGTGVVVVQGDRMILFTDGAAGDVYAAHNDALSASVDDSVADGVDYSFGTTTGTKLGTAVGQRIGFWNATPIVQPASANQAAVTAPAAFNNADNEIGGLTISATYDQLEVQALRDRCEELADDCRALRDKVATYETLLTAIRTALVNAGLIKGAA